MAQTPPLSLTGKTVAISGGTGGIGRELSRTLVSLGARLVLLDRNEEKSRQLERELLTLSPAPVLGRIGVDLADPDSVIRAGRELEQLPIDILILNAGIYQVLRYKCATGLDNVFQVNSLSPYYLARTLLPRLRARGGRVVAVGSIAHNNAPTDREDVDFSTREKSSLVYGNSKRFLMFALYALAGEGGVSVVHPGITLTNISAHHPPWLFRLMKWPMKVIFPPPGVACRNILAGVFEDCRPNEWIGPAWLGLWGPPRKERLDTCPPDEMAWIARQSEALYQDMKKRADLL